VIDFAFLEDTLVAWFDKIEQCWHSAKSITQPYERMNMNRYEWLGKGRIEGRIEGGGR
jgi:hypothetical protein